MIYLEFRGQHTLIILDILCGDDKNDNHSLSILRTPLNPNSFALKQSFALPFSRTNSGGLECRLRVQLQNPFIATSFG